MAELIAAISTHIAAWLWVVTAVMLIVLGIEKVQAWWRRR